MSDTNWIALWTREMMGIMRKHLATAQQSHDALKNRESSYAKAHVVIIRMWRAAIEAAEKELAAIERGEECTGVAARWCPIHGDCTDDPNVPDDGDRWSAHCSDKDCPLHGIHSTHAERGEYEQASKAQG